MDGQLLLPKPSTAKMVGPEPEFDWRSDDSIVLGHQPATAIYRNACNAVVIRQEGFGDEEDHFVILRDAEAVRVVIDALRTEVKAGGGHG